ncbi:hypothetical protein [Corynebacterium nasicanis]|uniref:Uncharacterized protein n=1 Tax=Corynebacterium nasicanis TaxID=1448267 RepID=A0ABW1QEV4_9CORY
MTVVLVVAAPIILALFAMQMEKLESWILPSAPAAAAGSAAADAAAEEM